MQKQAASEKTQTVKQRKGWAVENVFERSITLPVMTESSGLYVLQPMLNASVQASWQVFLKMHHHAGNTS